MFNCSSSSIPVTTWCVCMYYAMYCGGALIKNHGPCSGRGWTRSRWSLSCSPAAAPTQVTTVSRSDSLKTLASRSHGSWLELQTAHQRRIFTEFGLALHIRPGPPSCSGLGKHRVWWRRHLIHKQMKWFILLETLDLDQFWSLGLGTIFSLRKFNEICIVKIKQGLMDLRLLWTDMMSVNLHWSFDILTLMGRKAWQGPVTTKAWEILLFLP